MRGGGTQHTATGGGEERRGETREPEEERSCHCQQPRRPESQIVRQRLEEEVNSSNSTKHGSYFHYRRQRAWRVAETIRKRQAPPAMTGGPYTADRDYTCTVALSAPTSRTCSCPVVSTESPPRRGQLSSGRWQCKSDIVSNPSIRMQLSLGCGGGLLSTGADVHGCCSAA